MTIAPSSAIPAELGWRAAIRDLPREHGFEPLRVEGTLPEELTGTIYRTGPAVFSAQGARYRHLFDGDGAVSAVRFAGGRAEGAVRLVETRGLVAERRAGRPLFAGYGTLPPGLRRVLARPKNVANTSMLAHAGRLFALWEAGLPTEIHPDSLATLGETDLDGVVPMAFSAHPHAVAARRTSYNFGVRFGRKSRLDLFALPHDGAGVRRLGELPIPATMVHDFIATERHLVFFVSPLRLRPLPMLLGLKSFSEALDWRPQQGTEVIVAPIDAPERAVRFHAEPFYQWHFANAWEEQGEIVVDAITYPDFASNRWLGSLVESGPPAPIRMGEYQRVRIDVAARALRREPRADLACEFPRVAPAREGARHTVAWVASMSPAAAAAVALPDSISRLDPETGATLTWSSGGLASEPLFVPRPGAAGEDDGWLLALIYDPPRDASCLAVLDARDPSRGPLARAWFDHHLPPTFHGTFVS